MDNDTSLVPKKGDMKINSDDMVEFMQRFEQYQYFVFNNLDTLNEEERASAQCCYDSYRRFLYKYIVTSDLRRKEHLWFLLLKKIDNAEYEKIDKGQVKENEIEDISLYIDFLKSLLVGAQELPDTINVLLGTIIAIFGEDSVRREVWGVYLEMKSERERITREVNQD